MNLLPSEKERSGAQGDRNTSYPGGTDMLDSEMLRYANVDSYNISREIRIKAL